MEIIWCAPAVTSANNVTFVYCDSQVLIISLCLNTKRLAKCSMNLILAWHISGCQTWACILTSQWNLVGRGQRRRPGHRALSKWRRWEAWAGQGMLGLGEQSSICGRRCTGIILPGDTFTVPVPSRYNANDIWSAQTRTIGPPQKTIGDVRGVTVSSTALTQVTTRGNSTRIISTGSFIERSHICCTAFLNNQCLQARASWGPFDAINDHLENLTLGTRILNNSILVAGPRALVTLHQSRVDYPVVGGLDTNAPLAFLHNNWQDEVRIDTAGFSHLADEILHGIGFVFWVIGKAPLRAAVRYGFFICLKHGFKRVHPLVTAGPAVGNTTVSSQYCRVETGAALTKGISGAFHGGVQMKMGRSRFSKGVKAWEYQKKKLKYHFDRDNEFFEIARQGCTGWKSNVWYRPVILERYRENRGCPLLT